MWFYNIGAKLFAGLLLAVFVVVLALASWLTPLNFWWSGLVALVAVAAVVVYHGYLSRKHSQQSSSKPAASYPPVGTAEADEPAASEWQESVPSNRYRTKADQVHTESDSDPDATQLLPTVRPMTAQSDFQPSAGQADDEDFASAEPSPAKLPDSYWSDYFERGCKDFLYKMPPVYDEVRHIKHFFKKEVLRLLVVALVLALVVLLGLLRNASQGHDLIQQILGYLVWAAAIWLAWQLVGLYRNYWTWQHHPIKCDPRDGMVFIFQTGNWKIGLRGSSPDPYSVDEVELKTPRQSWWETYVPFFRNSHTVRILRDAGDEQKILEELHDVKNANHLVAIQVYRKQLRQRSNDIATQQLRLTQQALEESRRTNALLASQQSQHLTKGFRQPSDQTEPPSKSEDDF